MVRKVDFFIELIGGDKPMDPITWDNCRTDQNAEGPPPGHGKFEAWSRNCIARKESRTVFHPSATLNNTDVIVTRSTLFIGMLDQVAKVNDGNRAWSNFGVVVMYGSSIGATTALALAASLDQNGVRVNYLCLSDLPLFQFGGGDLDLVGRRSTTLPDMGDGAGSPRVPFNWHFDWANNTQPDSRDVPRTRLVSDMPNVRVKENNYQSLGNRVKAAVGMNKWVWSSGMAGEEIHGEISNDGWNNVLDNAITIKDRFRLPNKMDDAFHIAFNLKTRIDFQPKGLAELVKL